MTTEFPADKVALALREVMQLFADGDYSALEQLTHGVRLAAHEMKQAINEYGRTLLPPPNEAYDSIFVIPIDESLPHAYAVTMYFHTLEEGVSDLELQATLIEDPAGGKMTVEIDDILVA